MVTLQTTDLSMLVQVQLAVVYVSKPSFDILVVEYTPVTRKAGVQFPVKAVRIVLS